MSKARGGISGGKKGRRGRGYAEQQLGLPFVGGLEQEGGYTFANAAYGLGIGRQPNYPVNSSRQSPASSVYRGVGPTPTGTNVRRPSYSRSSQEASRMDYGLEVGPRSNNYATASQNANRMDYGLEPGSRNYAPVAGQNAYSIGYTTAPNANSNYLMSSSSAPMTFPVEHNARSSYPPVIPNVNPGYFTSKPTNYSFQQNTNWNYATSQNVNPTYHRTAQPSRQSSSQPELLPNAAFSLMPPFNAVTVQHNQQQRSTALKRAIPQEPVNYPHGGLVTFPGVYKHGELRKLEEAKVPEKGKKPLIRVDIKAAPDGISAKPKKFGQFEEINVTSDEEEETKSVVARTGTEIPATKGTSSSSSGSDGEDSGSSSASPVLQLFEEGSQNMLETVGEDYPSETVAIRRDNTAECQKSDEEDVEMSAMVPARRGPMMTGSTLVIPEGLGMVTGDYDEEEVMNVKMVLANIKSEVDDTTIPAIKDEPVDVPMPAIKNEPEESTAVAVVKNGIEDEDTDTEVMFSGETPPNNILEIPSAPSSSSSSSGVLELGPGSAIVSLQKAPPPSLPSTSAVAAATNSGVIPYNGNVVQIPGTPGLPELTSSQQRILRRMKEKNFSQTEFGRQLGLALKLKSLKRSTLPCVREGRIMLIGPARFTSLISGHFEKIKMKENVVLFDPEKMEPSLKQHKKEGNLSKWQSFIYMLDCDDHFDQKVVLRHLKMVASCVDEKERIRIELIYCRSISNKSEYPAVNLLSKFVDTSGIISTTLRYDVDYCLQGFRKAVYSKFVSCATGVFKLLYY